MSLSNLRIGPVAFLRLCQATLAVIALNIVTGATVRLTDSGLGCPDWPTCAHDKLTPPLSLHPVVEFANRMVVVVLVVFCALTVVAAFRRTTVRRDLVWLSGGLILGVIGEAVVGAFVVYSKLNPYVVMVHFMIGMLLLAVAVVLALQAGHAPGRGMSVVTPAARWLGRALVALVLVVLTAGSATTGAGPHAGGVGAKRIPVSLHDMARTHAEIVLTTLVVLLVLLYVLWRTDAPAGTQDRGRILLAAMVVQGIIGYTQYFTHLPVVLVGIHVFGAAVVWSAVLWFHAGMTTHPAEVADPLPAAPPPEPAAAR